MEEKASNIQKEANRIDASLPKFTFHGGNRDACSSLAEEYLLAGCAGSGKTIVNLWRLHEICKAHAGARCLIVRKTRESMTESVLVTWERDILGPDHPVLTKRPVIRRVRQSYVFENGSEVIVAGIDKPGKILSSEYDVIYSNEATDLTLEDWETLSSRLRSSRVPFQQIIADCNPTTPHHWLYKRYQTGLLQLFTSTHKDNPRYFDCERQEWTELGKQYLARLERLTGARRDRFLYGKWVAAEGAVYAFDTNVHQLSKDWQPPPSWQRLWAIDWGKSAPTSLGMFAVDPDGRLYHYREWYKTHTRADSLGKWCKAELESGREPMPYAVVTDIDLDGSIAQFEMASGLSIMLADKSDREKGIQQMQARFDLQDDGKPRIYFKDGALANDPDRILVDRGEPTNCIEELMAYVWDENILKDQPIEGRDHACDRTRYLIVFADNTFPGPNGQNGAGVYSKLPDGR